MALVALALLVGLSLALGAAPLFANLAAGLAIQGLRLYRRGDRVRLAGYAGAVEASGPLVTRLRTGRNEVVVVPNALVMNGVVVNDSDAVPGGDPPARAGGPSGDTALAPPGWQAPRPPPDPLLATQRALDLFQQAVRAVEAARMRTAARR
jgi:hypothetical protein